MTNTNTVMYALFWFIRVNKSGNFSCFSKIYAYKARIPKKNQHSVMDLMVVKYKRSLFSLSHPVVDSYGVIMATMRPSHPPEDTTVIASS